MRGRALRRLSPLELMAAVVAHISAGGIECQTDPEDKPAPFVMPVFTGSEPGRSRTVRIDEMTVELHCIAPDAPSQAGVLSMVNEVEEHMEAFVSIPAPFTLVDQVEDGVTVVKRDPSGEWHAVVQYRFIVSYGLNIK